MVFLKYGHSFRCPKGEDPLDFHLLFFCLHNYKVVLTFQSVDEILTSAEREVKDSRRSGMYQSYNFLTRLGKQSL